MIAPRLVLGFLFGVLLLCSPCQSHEASRVDRPPNVAKLYWTTEDAVDRLDVQHLGASIRRLHGTSEARAIAVWRYVRETMFHYPMRNENHADQFDAAKLINVYGYSFCTQQAVTAAAIGQAVGLPARVISVPGHGMYELFYDGQWHAFCTTSGFYVRTRNADGHISSMQEMQADPSLVTTAVAERRASVPFLPCAGGPNFLGKPEGSEKVPYALSYRHYDEAFFADAVKNWKDMGPPNTSEYQAWIRLRKGESVRLDWSCSPHFQPPVIDAWLYPPRHLCGEKDRANPFFDEIACYGRTFTGITSYRYYGSGEHVWRPSLRTSQDLSDWVRHENVRAEDGFLRTRDPTSGGVAELEMSGPYLYATGVISGVSARQHGELTILIQGADALAEWVPLYTAPQGEKSFEVSLGDIVLPKPPVDANKKRDVTPYRFRVRLELGGDATLSNWMVRATIQHNWLALPRLHPGANVVEIRSPVEELPSGIQLELSWDEQGEVRTLRQPQLTSRGRYPVLTRATTYPRMQHVILSRTP